MKALAIALVALMTLSSMANIAAAEERVTVGSKAFPESWILGEALCALARESGAACDHRQNLGGTEIVLAALKSGSVDVYVEYTGTIDEVILAKGDSLAALGLATSAPLGFNDGYALVMKPRPGIAKISDLAAHPELRFGLTHEFLGRRDGWPGLAARYALSPSDVRGMQHELAFEALASGSIDVTDAYTTDAQIDRLGLVTLDDDRAFYPRYDAVLLYRVDLPKRAPGAFAAMSRLVGAVDTKTMTRANAAVAIDHTSAPRAAEMLLPRGGSFANTTKTPPSPAAAIAHDVARHLLLVSLSLLAAILFGVPFGILATRSRGLAAATLTSAGVVQTVPSLALLALLIPIFGVGAWPAVVALFLYGLLPIVRATYLGLATIPSDLTDAADALGLSPSAKLTRVLLPLASRSILGGIKTSAVINVGTATIAALVGAEGLGNPILQGIALRDTSLILRGALPAAALALLVEAIFSALERVVVPRGLRLGR